MKAIVSREILLSDRIAIADDSGKAVTYKELAAKAAKLSGYVEKRSLVFLLCDRHMETMEFLYQILYIHAVPFLLPGDIEEEILDHLFKAYRPQYIYCDQLHAISGTYDCYLKFGRHRLLKTGENPYGIHPDLAVLLSTSGTTGSVKMVRLSYGNLFFSAQQVCMRMDMNDRQKGLSPLSASYVYGFAFCLWHWYCGANLLVTEQSVLSKGFSEFYLREKADNFAGTPYIYRMLHRIGFWDAEKLEGLHWAMSAGSQMNDEDQLRMVSLMKDKFWIMYGQTECTCFISGMNFDERRMKLGSVGKLLNHMEALIDKTTGELILKGKNIGMGYAENGMQLAAGDINRGILRTGDAACMDEDGYIYLKGRLTRYVKVLDKRVSLDDIEGYLERKIPGAEFACIGTDDRIAVLYAGNESDLSRQVYTLLDRNLRIPKKFVSCRRLETIPRNSAGKIQYGQLREESSEGKNTGNMQ